jgi:hypothetical protein
MHQLRLLARNDLNKLQTVTSKLRIKLLTDAETNKPITKENVWLLTPELKVILSRTDENGIVEFQSIPVAPLSLAYLVLPDILEGWSDDYQWQTSFPILAEVEAPELNRTAGDDYENSLLGSKLDVDLLECCRNFSKDDVLRFATGLATDYRAKDYTKHPCLTQRSTSSTTLELRVDRLTAEEKFEYFKQFFEGHDVRYYAGKMNYDKHRHVFTFKAGAVCNQFANFFLGFWLNHNAAFTTTGSVSDFGTILDNFISKMDKYAGSDQNYHFRGYNDAASAIGAPAGVPSDKYGGYEYISSDLKDNTIWDAHAHRYVNEALMSKLGFITVFCITDKGEKEMKVGHHGGMMIAKKHLEAGKGDEVHETIELHKLAADGYPQVFFKYKEVWYPYSDPKLRTDRKHLGLTGKEVPAKGVTKKTYYSQRKIEFTLMDEPDYKARNCLHLRLWAIKSLRPGGYAPGDIAGSYASASYAAIDSVSKPPDDIDTSSTNFRLWPPRFIAWEGPTSEKSIKEFTSECGKIADFLAIKTKKFKVKYTITTPAKGRQKAKTTDHEEDYEGEKDSFARLVFEKDHKKELTSITITEVSEIKN